MNTYGYILIYFLINCSYNISCWEYFTSLRDYTLTNSYKDSMVTHSEYRFGNCRLEYELKFYAHVHLDHIEILGKTIIRGWLKINRIPTCVVIRAISWPEDTFRSTSFNFQVCVPRITYCHSHHRYKYYYYEWYIPGDMIGGMDWDLYFYGPQKMNW